MESKIAAMLRAGLSVPELSLENLESLADRHVTRALHALRVQGTHISFLETDIGIVTFAILRYQSVHTGSPDDYWIAYTTALDRALQSVIHEDNDPSLANDDGCEVLYGRAGLLYAFLLLRNALRRGLSDELAPEFAHQLNQLIVVNNLRVTVDSIIARGRRGSRWLREELGKVQSALPPLMWSWHQKRYLGGAHGVGASKMNL